MGTFRRFHFFLHNYASHQIRRNQVTSKTLGLTHRTYLTSASKQVKPGSGEISIKT